MKWSVLAAADRRCGLYIMKNPAGMRWRFLLGLWEIPQGRTWCGAGDVVTATNVQEGEDWWTDDDVGLLLLYFVRRQLVLWLVKPAGGCE
jgi:hypothetical protein